MKKFWKIIGWIAGIVLLLLLLLVVAVELFFPVEKAKQMAIEKGTETLGRPINVRDVDVSIWGGLGVLLQGVTVANPPDWPDSGYVLAADNIDVKLQLFPLLSGEYRLDRLIIDRPLISLRTLEDGRNNFTFEFADTVEAAQSVPSEARPAAAAVSFDRLEINDGQLSYRDDSSNTSLTLADFGLSTALENPRENFFKSKGRIAIGRIIAVTEDTIPPISITVRYEADYDMARKVLTLEDAECTLNELGFLVSGEMNHSGEAMTARGRLRAQDISINDVLSLVPPQQARALDGFSFGGKVTFDANVEYDGSLEEPLNYSGDATISDARMSYAEVDGDLKLRRAMIDFESNKARLNVEDATFDGKPLKAHFLIENFDDPSVNGEISGQLDLAFMQPFLPAEANHRLGGEAQFSVKASGPVADVENLDVSGEVKVSAGRYSSDLVPEPLESFALDLYFDRRLVRVTEFSAQSPSGQLSFSGRINDLVPYLMADSARPAAVNPSIDGTAKGKLNLAMLNPLLPEEGQPELTGTVDMDLSLAGDIIEPSGLRIRGNMNINDASYRDTMLAEPIRHFEAGLTMVPDTIRIDRLAARFETSDMSLTGSIIDPFPYLLPLESIDKSRIPKPFLRFHVTSHRFNVDSMFPEATPGAPGEVVASDTIPPFIMPRLDGRGTIAFDTVVYMDIEFTDLTADAEIEDLLVTITNVTGKVYSGDIEGETTVDFTSFQTPVYRGAFNASRIEANDFVSRFTDFGGYVFGQFDIDGNYNASGWEGSQIKNTLEMTSDARMQQGRVVTSGAIYQGLNGIAQLFGESFEREQPLKNLVTKIIVDDGRVRFDGLTTRLGDIGDLDLTGFYSFEGDVSYQGSIFLTPEMTKKLLSKKGLLGDVAGVLKDDSVDRIKLPLSIGGTMTSPTFNIDYSAVKENLKDNAADKAKDALKGLFKKDDN